ncbi:hypothetical protein QFC19_000126 [Naganishia cerealis]|uniref:Uncharacterized protein n=1 Tax=Naganishia cerealis TaxID=610337 RepID=A0ACC2WRA3_9TREE|nr:hypothetical protein QFC19_000126 [Naganishia cerealis]
MATPPMPQPNRFSSNVSEASYASDYQGNFTAPGVRPKAAQNYGNPVRQNQGTATTGTGVFMWNDKDDEMDDALHTPDPAGKDLNHFNLWSARGWLNTATIFILLAGLIMLFGGFPIIVHFKDDRKDEGSATSGFNLGGINSTGQVPQLGNFPSLIDPDTPPDAYTRKGFDGSEYTLAFSDEFNVAGRTFFPGDDPYWEGVDLHYWPTGDFEWYDPSAITTRDGSLVITLTEEPIHDLNFKSGMLQSWNKLCFSHGVYIEAYTYDTCDIGTLPNQTYVNGTGPEAALTSNQGGSLSYLPGQRLSRCTCSGEDHPGPKLSDGTLRGRAAPEIDVIEAQIEVSLATGEMSQSLQLAPYDAAYWPFNTTADYQFYDTSITKWNSYRGGIFQQAVSALTYVPNNVYQNTSKDFNTYGLEWYADTNNRENGYIAWVANGVRSWTVHASAIRANPLTEIGPRIIPEEPMYLIMNFGMSNNFQSVTFSQLNFPNEMHVDYIRVWTKDGLGTVGCSPEDYPTAEYIAAHENAYTKASHAEDAKESSGDRPSPLSSPTESQGFAAKLFRRWIGSSPTESPQIKLSETLAGTTSSVQGGTSSSQHKLEVPELRSPTPRLQVYNLGVTKNKQSSGNDSPSARISRLALRRQLKRTQTQGSKPGSRSRAQPGSEHRAGDPIIPHMRTQMRDEARKRHEEREQIFATLKSALPENAEVASKNGKGAKGFIPEINGHDDLESEEVPGDIVDVYNFPPSIENIPRRDQFAAHRLPGYVTASEDKDLLNLAKQHQLKYYGSTSTLTAALSQIYFLISGFRPVNTSNLSQVFADELHDQSVESSANDIRYSPRQGRVMEKMVTSDEKEMSRFMVSSPDSAVPESEQNQREAYHYSKLDCYDQRLPGNGTFDIKTRAALVIRHDRANYEASLQNNIWLCLKESFEKEFYDMSRSAFLKYSMQVRIGNMDGIFVAYHNTARIFGFQYISLAEMDSILHGSPEMGAQAFKLAVTLFETILEQATAIYPNQTFNLVLEAVKGDFGHLNIFVTPEIPNAETPIVHFKLSVKNTLDGQPVKGPVDFASIPFKRHNRVSWTVEYDLSKNHTTEAAVRRAESELQSARHKIGKMASLSLPAGKTKKDMESREKTSPTKALEQAVTKEGDIDQPIDRSKIEILPVPSRPAVYVKWKEPDSHVLRMREMAKRSGRQYTQRILRAGVKGKKPVVYRDHV